MDKIFAEDGQIDEAEITLGGHKPILPASYMENEEWVEEYKKQFETEPSFF